MIVIGVCLSAMYHVERKRLLSCGLTVSCYGRLPYCNGLNRMTDLIMLVLTKFWDWASGSKFAHLRSQMAFTIIKSKVT